MTQEYISGWIRGAEDALKDSIGSLYGFIDIDYYNGYKEGYRIGKAFRDAR